MQAITLLRDAVEKNPKSPALLYTLAQDLYFRSKKFRNGQQVHNEILEEAADLIERALDKYEDHRRALILSAEIHKAQGKFDDAEYELLRYLSMTNFMDFEALKEMGYIYLEGHEPGYALDAFIRASHIEIDDESLDQIIGRLERLLTNDVNYARGIDLTTDNIEQRWEVICADQS